MEPAKKSPSLPVVLVVLIVLFVAACSSSEPENDTSAAKAEVATELDRAVEGLRISEGKAWGLTVPGLAAAAITSDNQVSDTPAVTSGASDPPGTAPLMIPDRFHIGSATKTFTAAVILQLDQEGKLSLQDPISKWISYPNGAKITVEMLLSHTSGIPNFTQNPARTLKDTPETSIALSETQPPVFAPGSSWSYSNTNYIILGVIAERVTGKTWQDEIESRLLKPLGLTDTYVWTGESRPPTVDGSRIACSGLGEPECSPPESNLPLIAVTDGFDWSTAWSAGAIVSTPMDLVRWMRALVNGDVLDAKHRELLTTPTPQSVEALNNKEHEYPIPGKKKSTFRWTGYSYGLCRFEVDGEGEGWGHSGIINGFVSNVVQMTDSGHTVALTSNFEYFDLRAGLGRLVIDTSGQ
jgi:D-alanyl-D-alanine carboxypeptidase